MKIEKEKRAKASSGNGDRELGDKGDRSMAGVWWPRDDRSWPQQAKQGGQRGGAACGGHGCEQQAAISG